MEQIREVLAGSETPLNSAQIADAVFGSKKTSCREKVDEALMELIRSESVFEHPPRKRGERERFWRESPAAWTEARILGTLAKKEKLTLRAVRESIPTSYRGLFDEALGSLMREKRVHSLTVGRTKYLMNRTPKPTEHLLRRHFSALAEIIERLIPHCKTKLSVNEVVGFLDRFGTTEPVSEPFREIPEGVMYSWYREDLSRLMGSKSVPIPWTWIRYENWCREQGSGADLPGFQNRLKELALLGKIELVAHGMSEPIEPAELSIAIKTEQGELLYYWKWLQEDAR